MGEMLNKKFEGGGGGGTKKIDQKNRFLKSDFSRGNRYDIFDGKGVSAP